MCDYDYKTDDFNIKRELGIFVSGRCVGFVSFLFWTILIISFILVSGKC